MSGSPSPGGTQATLESFMSDSPGPNTNDTEARIERSGVAESPDATEEDRTRGTAAGNATETSTHSSVTSIDAAVPSDIATEGQAAAVAVSAPTDLDPTPARNSSAASATQGSPERIEDEEATEPEPPMLLRPKASAPAPRNRQERVAENHGSPAPLEEEVVVITDGPAPNTNSIQEEVGYILRFRAGENAVLLAKIDNVASLCSLRYGHPSPTEAGDCSICCYPYTSSQEVAVTKCGHSFHAMCLADSQAPDNVMIGQCPNCRSNLETGLLAPPE